MQAYSVDVFGMAETNTSWQHTHLQLDFKDNVRKQFQYGKTVYGFPSPEVDPSHPKETFQAGGTVQVVKGKLTTTVHGTPITDPTGLGRWCGMTFVGKADRKLSVITGYRVCSGSINSTPLGSSFHREYAHLRQQGDKQPNPRQKFLSDLSVLIRTLQKAHHAILLMFDANSTLETDHRLHDMVATHDLADYHAADPAPSTYIGAPHRRIDYMLGCPRVKAALSRQGSLSYFEGPQSDHRALYVDLNLESLFGTGLTKLPLRRLSVDHSGAATPN
jgi:hypothetical protein